MPKSNQHQHAEPLASLPPTARSRPRGTCPRDEKVANGQQVIRYVSLAMKGGGMKKAGKGGRVIPMRSGRVAEMRGALVGRVVGSIAGGFSVDFPGNPHGPTLARSTVPSREVARACEDGAHPEVMLLFEAERSDRPVILGLIAPAPAPEPKPEAKPNELREALVDGRRVVLDAKDELVLKCGKALIVMRRNGRVVVRGTHIETDSEGVNRIKGGSVQVE
jgi:hypothetical protein